VPDDPENVPAEGHEMNEDERELRELNTRIGLAESQGDRAFLADVLAPALAFRRANGKVVDRTAFLEGVGPGPVRETEIGSVTLHGAHRAVVTCVVTMVDGDRRTPFHNLRVFVRSDTGTWQLLAWANEPR
jgi:hypothetical protein